MVLPGSAPELGVGDAGLLEVDDVHLVAEDVAVHLDRIQRQARDERGVEADDPGATVGVRQRHGPDDDAAPVVASEHRLFDAEMVQKADQIAGQMFHVIGLDRVGSIGQAVTALVGRDHPAPGRGQGRDLVSPGIGELRKAVAQHDRNALARAGFVIGHADSVDGRERRLRHGRGQRAVHERFLPCLVRRSPWRFEQLFARRLRGSRCVKGE
jgi:hypothetical protein